MFRNKYDAFLTVGEEPPIFRDNCFKVSGCLVETEDVEFGIAEDRIGMG
jgi:hypothetical protein